MFSLPPNVHLMQPGEDDTYLSQDFTCIYQWMHRPEGLGMRFSNAECIVYARIWSASRNGMGVYCEPQKKLAETFGFSRKTVNLALKELLERGYIMVTGVLGNEKTGIRAYRCDPAVANRAIAAIMDLDELRRSLTKERNAALLGGLPDPGTPTPDAEPSPDAAPTAPADAMEPQTPALVPAPSPDDPAFPSEPDRDPVVVEPRPQPVREPSPEKRVVSATERECGFNALLREYPKSCNGPSRRAAREAYNKLVDEGHTPEEILEALHAYLRDHRRRNGGQLAANYLKSFQNFLTFANGARQYLEELERERASGGEAPPDRPTFRHVSGPNGRGSWISGGRGVTPIELLAPDDASYEELLRLYDEEVSHAL